MSETIGQRLKKTREYRHLTFQKVSEATRIRVPFLQALEADDYSVMPSAAQGRGFLRNYSEFLGLNLDEMLAEVQKNPPTSTEISGPLPQVDLASAVKGPPPAPGALPVEESVKPGGRTKTGKKPSDTQSGRRRKKEEPVVPQPEQIESPPQEMEQTQVEIQPRPVEQQVEVPRDAETVEAKPGLLARLAAAFRIRVRASRRESRPPSPAPDQVETKTETPAPRPVETAEEIFAEIGLRLRKRREMLSLALDEVERHTHVRAVFLKALEEGRFEQLPSPVQTRGMLANYAAFLDLDTDVILLRFADVLQVRHRQKYPETHRPKTQMEVAASIPPLRSFIAADLIFGVTIVAILIGLAIWGVGRVLSSRTVAATLPSAPSISEVLASTPEPTLGQEVTFIPAADTPIASTGTQGTTGEIPTPGLNANVQVNVFAVERAFVRVAVDGEVVFDGRVLPGESYLYEAEDQVSILTGNAAALRITYNGRDLGLMGNFGQVVSQIYTITGLATPTATIPPTPTDTPLVTLTPTATTTPTVTPTLEISTP